MNAPQDLREFLDIIRGRGELAQITVPVDADLEIAEIHRRVIAAGGPALMFTDVKGSPFPVVTNLFGTPDRVTAAFGDKPARVVAQAARLPQELPPNLPWLWHKRGLLGDLMKVGTTRKKTGPVSRVRRWDPDLTKLPALTTWSEDGGPFLTLPLVYTEHPDGHGPNLGMYRSQIYDQTHSGLHWQIGKGGGFHHHLAESRNQALPVNIFLGGPPALMLSAIAPLPENVPELLLASLLLGQKLPLAENPAGPLPLAADAEFALVGEALPGERRPEGPFGDHYGYYSLEHDYPVFHCKAMLHRENPIFPATVVGKPRQEDFFLGDFLQELLSPIFPVVMSGVRDLWSYGETGYHSLAAAVVQDRYKREAMMSAFRILGEGQLSLTKFLLVLDQPRDLRDFSGVLEHVLERTDFRTDLFVFSNVSMDTLDYTGPVINEGSKGVLLGLGEVKRELPREFSGELPSGIQTAEVFCGGCLVVSGPGAGAEPEAAARIASHESFSPWPLVFLVDDAQDAVRTEARFLWTAFTRFEPGADIAAAGKAVERNHLAYTAPLVIDARLRPSFPKELFCDKATAETVTRRWSEYFPDGLTMGDSAQAHLG